MIEQEGKPEILIRCGNFDPHKISIELQDKIKQNIWELLVQIFVRVFSFNTSENAITKLFIDERAVERALNFTSSFITLGNVLGHNPKTSLGAWTLSNEKEYPTHRNEEWDIADRQRVEDRQKVDLLPEISINKGEPPKEPFDLERIKHTNIKTVSLIRKALWDRADWAGTGYFWCKSDSEPPILGLLFRNSEAAASIFSNWHKEISKDDNKEILRISIIRHINKSFPYNYRLIIGINPFIALTDSKTKQAIMAYQIKTMEPKSEYNLTEFLRRYKQCGIYYLGYTIVQNEQIQHMPNLDSTITKRSLFIREAWEIGRYDPDCLGIHEDDDPIIPREQKNAPVLELLDWLRNRESSKS